ncbi:MAG TPA: hypothetical protein VFZ25_03925 [Chloroflexota bacterium]|nr:hypothetical protein [Chloroflexota bacterium]
MSHRSRMQDLLPPPYSIEPDSVLTSVLNLIALEMDAFQEDLDRYQQTHWIRSVYRLSDAEKLGALTGIKRLPWEDLDLYRERLLALVVALLAGATGPRQIRQFVFDYLRRAESVLGATFVPGLATLDTVEAAYGSPPDQPRYQPLGLVEFPRVRRRSGTLDSLGGNIPYLYRWQELNRGLDETVATFDVTGVRERTSVPIIVNLTTGELIGYAGVLRFGQTLSLRLSSAGDSTPREAVATIDDVVATSKLFSLANYTPGVPFRNEQLDPKPRLPRMARGANEWLFLNVGLYDIPGLDRFSFAIADDLLREGVFDETTFDNALFPAGTKARLEMAWTETEPASFQVHVPRYIVVEPGGRAGGPRWVDLEAGLRDAIGTLHAAGVRAAVKFDPFVETQEQTIRFRLPVKVIDPEIGPAGQGDEVAFGGRFGESRLGSARFE